MPSTYTYRGDAPLVAQISTVQITGYDAATTYKITINGRTISQVGTGGTASTTAAALCALLVASTYYEFLEITFTVVTDTITMTAVTAGIPFTATSSKTGGAGTIGAFTTTTPNSGPSDMSVAANYSGGVIPSTGDTLVFENLRSGQDPMYGGDALTAVTFAAVYIRNCACKFGLPVFNGKYFEYRQRSLILKATILYFNCPECTFADIDSSSVQTTFTCQGTGTPSVNGMKTLLWKGTHASNVCNFDRGSIGVATLAGEVATIATLNCGYIDQGESDSDVKLGGQTCTITLGTVNRVGGKLEMWCAASAAITSKEKASDLIIYGSGTLFNVVSYAGHITYYSSGTITNMTLGEGIVFDSTQNELGFEVTNIVQGHKSCKFADPFKRATGPSAGAWLGIKANGCKTSEVTVDRGQDAVIVVN